MRFSLVNPRWTFDQSIYFGCREPHLPLEYGYSRALLQKAGHEVQIVDGQLYDLTLEEIEAKVRDFETDFAVVTTAPSYLFWRCAPPELRVPRQLMDALRHLPCKLVGVGPHASTTPRTTLSKLGADVVVLGECEEVLPKLAGDWSAVDSICFPSSDGPRIQGLPHAANMSELPALQWEPGVIARHSHHHHRFEAAPTGPGAEMETSRGCPYHCTFCAKDNFRNSFRRRPVPVVAAELDGLVQTRIDLWSHEMIDLLGKAGCVSIEAGVESITEAGRDLLAKKCKLSTSEITERLLHAKECVPFVQANLLDCQTDDPDEVEQWREELRQRGVWSNKPVPLFPYPGSPDYTQRWGAPDDVAWERAHDAYLKQFDEFSDIQEQRPAELIQLEAQR
jgi:hypothetical protein